MIYDYCTGKSEVMSKSIEDIYLKGMKRYMSYNNSEQEWCLFDASKSM